MPTARPRITITLTKHSHEVLVRLSGASGESMSEIVAGFVDLAVPSLERVVVVLERARSAPEEVRTGLRSAVERAERDLMPQLLQSLDQVELFMGQVEQATVPPPQKAPSAARRSPPPAARKRSGTPVPVTRGSGTGKPPRARGVARSAGGRSRG